MLGAGAGDAHDIDFLECVIADQSSGDLTGKDNQGNGIHIGGSNPGNRVGGSPVPMSPDKRLLCHWRGHTPSAA